MLCVKLHNYKMNNFYVILNTTKTTSRLESQGGCWQTLDTWYNTGVGVKWVIVYHLFIPYIISSPYLKTLPNNSQRFVWRFHLKSSNTIIHFLLCILEYSILINTGVDQKKRKRETRFISDLLMTIIMT